MWKMKVFWSLNMNGSTYSPVPSVGMSMFWKVMEATFRVIGTVSDGHLKMICAWAMALIAAATDSLSVTYFAFQLLS